MLYNPLSYFAQVYGTDVYGGASYQCNDVNCETGTDNVGVPSTGFYDAGPEIMVPVILGVSLVITAIVVSLKKHFRHQSATK